MPKQKQYKRTSPQKAKTVAQPKSASKRGQTSRSKSCANNQSQRPGQIKATKTPPKTAGKKSEIKQVDSIEIKIELIPVDLKTHKDKNGGHYHVIVDNVDEKHVSVGLSTKKKKGKNHPNYPLEKSPLDDGKNSYMRRQGTVDSIDSYHSPRKGTMTPKDYEQAKVYGERAKQKYLDGKKDKKK